MKSIYTVSLFFCLFFFTNDGLSQDNTLHNAQEMMPFVYPSAKMIVVSDWNGGALSLFETADEPRAVVILYKKYLLSNGWVVVKDITFENGYSLLFSKDGDNFAVISKRYGNQKSEVYTIFTGKISQQ